MSTTAAAAPTLPIAEPSFDLLNVARLRQAQCLAVKALGGAADTLRVTRHGKGTTTTEADELSAHAVVEAKTQELKGVEAELQEALRVRDAALAAQHAAALAARPLPRVVVTKADLVKQTALKLRAIRHKHAARLALHARIIQMAATEIRAINATLHKESVAVAGNDYLDHHTVTFEPCPSIAQQIDDDIGEVSGAGIDDVLQYASALLDDATDESLLLPSERA
jgi:hypothetical protein